MRRTQVDDWPSSDARWVLAVIAAATAARLALAAQLPLSVDESYAAAAAWTLPWIWIPLLWVLAAALRARPRDTRRWPLACLGSGPIFGFTLLTVIGSRGLPHWEAPGYFILLPLRRMLPMLRP